MKEVDQRAMVEGSWGTGERGAFLEEAASKLSLEGYIGICWKEKRKREEHCSYIPKRGNSPWQGKLYLSCIFRDTRGEIHTSQVIFKA